MTQVLPTFEDVFESLPRQNKLRDVGHAVACGLLDRNSRVVNNILDFCESDGMFPDPNAGRFSELVRTDFYRATHCRRMQKLIERASVS